MESFENVMCDVAVFEWKKMFIRKIVSMEEEWQQRGENGYDEWLVAWLSESGEPTYSVFIWY